MGNSRIMLNFQWDIVGEGDEKQVLIDYAEQLGVRNEVQFHGIDVAYKSRGIQEKIKSESHITEKSKTRRLLVCGRVNRKKGLDLLPSILSKLTRYNWASSHRGLMA